MFQFYTMSCSSTKFNFSNLLIFIDVAFLLNSTLFFIIYVTAHAKMSHLSVKTYSRFITYSNRAHSEQNDDTSMPSTFSLFPEI